MSRLFQVHKFGSSSGDSTLSTAGSLPSTGYRKRLRQQQAHNGVHITVEQADLQEFTAALRDCTASLADCTSSMKEAALELKQASAALRQCLNGS